jgi:hypothetical protein
MSAQSDTTTPGGDGQNAGPTNAPVMRVTTRPVEIGVVAIDERARPATELMPDDFEVYDSGRKRQLKFFSRYNGTQLVKLNPGTPDQNFAPIQSGSADNDQQRARLP